MERHPAAFKRATPSPLSPSHNHQSPSVHLREQVLRQMLQIFRVLPQAVVITHPCRLNHVLDHHRSTSINLTEREGLKKEKTSLEPQLEVLPILRSRRVNNGRNKGATSKKKSWLGSSSTSSREFRAPSSPTNPPLANSAWEDN